MKTINYIISIFPFIGLVLFSISVTNLYGVILDRTSMGYNTMITLSLVGIVMIFVSIFWYLLCGIIVKEHPFKLWSKTLYKMYNELNMF